MRELSVGLMMNWCKHEQFVSDLASSQEFYTRVFEGEIVDEGHVSSVLQLRNVMINLLHRSEAGGLVQPLPLADPEAGSKMLLTIKYVEYQV